MLNQPSMPWDEEAPFFSGRREELHGVVFEYARELGIEIVLGERVEEYWEGEGSAGIVLRNGERVSDLPSFRGCAHKQASSHRLIRATGLSRRRPRRRRREIQSARARPRPRRRAQIFGLRHLAHVVPLDGDARGPP